MFYGPGVAANATEFSEVDLSDVLFEDVDFRCGVNLDTVILPRTGVRTFSNAEAAFSRALRAAAGDLSDEGRIAFSVLGAEMYDLQNPIVVGEDILGDFLAAPDARATASI